MKKPKKLIGLGLVVIFVLFGFFVYLRPRYVVPILMYHHIDDQGKSSSLSVAPENFRRQMEFLSRHGYNVISLREFVQAKRKDLRLPGNTCVLTFDDGYEDNYTLAYPILKQYNLPATIFVIVDSIGQPGYMSFSQIKELAASGVIDIGSHTLAGDYLPGKKLTEIKRQIDGSKRILEARLSRKIDLFCYPIGGFTPEIQETVCQSGYLAACSTNRGRQQTYLNDDLFALKRIKIKDNWPNLFIFRVKLSGYYNLLRKVKNPH